MQFFLEGEKGQRKGSKGLTIEFLGALFIELVFRFYLRTECWRR